MREIEYLDLDLLVERADGGYRARVIASPVGQTPPVAFAVPFSDLELENFLLRIGRPRRNLRLIDVPQMAAIKAFGGQLFDMLFPGDLRVNLLSSLSRAEGQDAGLRIRLRLSDCPELAELPWEYLYDRARNRFFCLSDHTPLVRFLELPDPVRVLLVTPPLRVLAMIASPSDYPQLGVEEEWAKLNAAVGELEQAGRVTVERLEAATLRALQQRLRRSDYHVFHFIGHGGFDPRAEDGVLVLEDHVGRGRRVSGQELGTLLHDHRSLRLAVLNACEGARSDRTDPFSGTAQSLVQQGVPAVVAMQFEITDEAAITFAHVLYEAIADGYPLDAATAQGRKAIYADGNLVEWGTPVLYLRAPDGRIFDLLEPTPAEAAEPTLPEAAEPTIEDLTNDVLRLGQDERAVIQRAAVVGKQFHVADVVALTPEPDRHRVDAALELLASRDLVQRDHDPVPILPAKERGEAFKFRHVLIRETAYNGIVKQTRADLHERYATWLEETTSPERQAEFDELIGFHLAEAFQYRAELGFHSEEQRLLAGRAGERLAAAGRRAANRGNVQVSLKLLERAVGLLPEGHQARLDAALDLADARTEAGELDDAIEAYQDVVEAGKTARQPGLVMHARLGLLDVMAFRDLDRMLGGSSEIQEAILLFVELGDELGLAKARRLNAYVKFAVGRTVAAEAEARRATELAQKHGLEHLEAKARRLLCTILFWGPTPLDEVEAYAAKTLDWARARNLASLQAGALNVLGRAAAMRGDFELGRRLTQQARDISIDLGEVLTAAADSVAHGLVELLAGQPAAAEAALRAGYHTLEEVGATGPVADVAAMLARALILQGKDRAAERRTRICEELAATDQLDSQVKWRALRAIILARRGELEQAEELMREAVDRAVGSEQPDTQAEALADLAEVLRLGGKGDAATKVLDRAIGLYQRKGNVVAAGRLRELRAQPPAAPDPA